MNKLSADTAVMVAFGNELLKLATEKIDPDEFRITKREAERAARRLAVGTSSSRFLSGMGAMAVVSPAARTLAKGVAAGTLAKKNRGRSAYNAMKKFVKSPEALEASVGGSITGAALAGLSEGRDIHQARKKVKKYLELSQARNSDQLKRVL